MLLPLESVIRKTARKCTSAMSWSYFHRQWRCTLHSRRTTVAGWVSASNPAYHGLILTLCVTSSLCLVHMLGESFGGSERHGSHRLAGGKVCHSFTRCTGKHGQNREGILWNDISCHRVHSLPFLCSSTSLIGGGSFMLQILHSGKILLSASIKR